MKMLFLWWLLKLIKSNLNIEWIIYKYVNMIKFGMVLILLFVYLCLIFLLVRLKIKFYLFDI